MTGPSAELLVLGVDAGGSHTRALVVDGGGVRRGAGRSGPGNPTAQGALPALTAIREAADRALADAGAAVADLDAVVVAMAGERALVEEGIAVAFAASRRCEITGDVLAMFAGATAEPDGGVVIGGTGSVAARVADRATDLVVGGSGWLLGDLGSGYAAGRALVRAAVADLDGLGPETVLTTALLEELGLAHLPRDRALLERLAAVLTPMRAGQLAGLAPLVVRAAAPATTPSTTASPGPGAATTPDEVACSIIACSRNGIAGLVAALSLPPDAPLVLGGSFLVHGLLAVPGFDDDRLADSLAAHQLLPTSDGAAGAVALALDRAGAEVTSRLIGALATVSAPTR